MKDKNKTKSLFSYLDDALLVDSDYYILIDDYNKEFGINSKDKNDDNYNKEDLLLLNYLFFRFIYLPKYKIY